MENEAKGVVNVTVVTVVVAVDKDLVASEELKKGLEVLKELGEGALKKLVA